jgi:hypothetical protein
MQHGKLSFVVVADTKSLRFRVREIVGREPDSSSDQGLIFGSFSSVRDAQLHEAGLVREDDGLQPVA